MYVQQSEAHVNHHWRINPWARPGGTKLEGVTLPDGRKKRTRAQGAPGNRGGCREAARGLSLRADRAILEYTTCPGFGRQLCTRPKFLKELKRSIREIDRSSCG